MKVKSNVAAFRLLPAFSALVVAVLVLFLVDNEGYRLLFVHPLAFAVCYFLVLHRVFQCGLGARPFLTTLTLICAIRFVVLPALTVASSHYYGRSWVNPLDESVEKAILLMAWELACVSLLVFYFEVKREKKERWRQGPQSKRKENSLPAPSSYFFYYVFALVVLLLIFLSPAAVQTINFFLPRALAEDIAGLSTTERSVAYAFFLAKNLVAIALIVSVATMWRYKRPIASAIIASVIAVVSVGIYWGGSRIDILIPGIAFGIILYRLYGPAVTPFLLLGVATVGIAVGLVTIERQTVTLSGGAEPLVDVADTLQLYVGGVYNVAIAIETKSYYPDASRWSVLGMDFFRPMLGVNFLLKDVEVPYSNMYFNDRIWTHVDRRSQILPMVGQGYIHFGMVLAPLLTLVFVYTAYKLESLYHEHRAWEVKFVLLLVIIRSGFVMGQNSMNLINDMSMNLILFALVYGVKVLVHSRVRVG